MCKFFVVPGYGQALLGMPDTDMVNIRNMNHNTIDTHKTDRANNYSINTDNSQGSRHEQHYTNMMQEADRAKRCYANLYSISKFNCKDKPMDIDREPYEINYFLPGPTKTLIKQQVLKSHSNYREILKMYLLE